MVVFSEKEWELVGFRRTTIGGKKVVALLRNKKTHDIKELGFGQRGSSTYRDLTKVGGDPTHHDEKKRKAYHARHKQPAPKYSPSWFSWYYLW